MSNENLTITRELADRLLAMQPIERDDPNGSGCNLCPECFGAGKWNWSAGKVVSIDPIDHYAGCALEELRALLAAPAVERQGLVACAHEWTDDGESLLICTACGAQEDFTQALQFAFELGGTDDGSYQLEADELCEVIRKYTSTPAPVAAVLPDYLPRDTEDSDVLTDCRNEGWNACLDKLKELNKL